MGEGSSGSFNVGRGLMQGCILSTTLFSLFIDDIRTALKANERGVALGKERIVHLLYADDLVLIESSEEDLQKSLNLVGDWCEANALVVNNSKSGVLHVRPRKKQRTNSQLQLKDVVWKWLKDTAI